MRFIHDDQIPRDFEDVCGFCSDEVIGAQYDSVCLVEWIRAPLLDELIKIWLNMRSGELREQELEQGSQQRFPSSSHVVNKLKEAQIQWQVVL